MRRKAGFTLLELIIALAVAMVILASLYRLFTSGLRLYERGQVRSDLQAAGQVALSTIAGELRASALETVTLAQGTLEPGPTRDDCLIFRLPAGANGTLLPQETLPQYFQPHGTEVVLYAREAAKGALVRKTCPWAGDYRVPAGKVGEVRTLTEGVRSRVMASHVLSLAFEDDRQGTVTMTVVLQAQTRASEKDGGLLTESVSTQVHLRNSL